MGGEILFAKQIDYRNGRKMKYGDRTHRMGIQCFEVMGRARPSAKVASPPVFKMNIYAPNQIVARSRFWYFLKRMKKIKHANGVLVSCKPVEESLEQNVENYAVWARFDSRTGTHNVYKEFRDISCTGAVGQAIQALNGNHRAKTATIQIMGVMKIDSSQVRSKMIKDIHENDELMYPLIGVKQLKPRTERKRFVLSSI